MIFNDVGRLWFWSPFVQGMLSRLDASMMFQGYTGKKKGGDDDDDDAFGLVILISPDTLCQAATPSSTQPVSEVALLQPSFDINQPTAHQAGGSFEAIPTKVSRNLLECSFYWISTWFSAVFLNSRGVKNAWRWRYLRCPVFTMDVYESTCLLIGAPMDCTDQHFNHSFGQGRNSITASTTYLRDMLHKSYSVAQAIVRCFNKNHGVNLKESIC